MYINFGQILSRKNISFFALSFSFMPFMCTRKIQIQCLRKFCRQIARPKCRRYKIFNHERVCGINSNSNYTISQISTLMHFDYRPVRVAVKILNAKPLNKFYYRAYCEFSDFQLGLPCTSDDVKKSLSHHPASPPNARLLKVAVIGVPNSGKSTLINRLIGWKVCGVSEKVHTTQCSARAIHNEGEVQLVFVDTPGLLSSDEIRKYQPKPSMVMDPELSLQKADLIAVVHDVSNKFTRNALHPNLLRLLTLYPKIPSILILNKIDVFRRRNRTILLPITEIITDGVVAKERIPITEASRGRTSRHNDEERLRKTLLKEADDYFSDGTSGTNPEQRTGNCKLIYDLDSKPEPILENKLSGHLHPSPISETSNVSLVSNEEGAERDVSFKDVLSGRIHPTEHQVQKLIAGRKGWPGFNEVFMVSALKGVGMEGLKAYFLGAARRAQWIFSSDFLTDQSPQDIALMTVRSRCLSNLERNIPYELKFQLVDWQFTESDLLIILVHVLCPKNYIAKLVRGRGGRTVRKIAIEAEQDLRDAFRTEVRLKIGVSYDPTL